MKNIKKWFQKLTVLGLVTALLVGASVPDAVAAAAPIAGTEAYREDFYQAVNGEWLSKVVIPSNRPNTSEMYDITLLVEKRLQDDFEAMRTGKKPIPKDIPGFGNFLKLYDLSMDFAAREEQGVAPMLPELARIESLSSVEQLMEVLSEWVLDGMLLPVNYTMDTDLKQATKHALYLGLAGSILPDISYYDKNKQVGDKLLAVYAKSVTELAMLAGKTQEEAATIAKEALEYDRMLAPFQSTAVEKNDSTNMYNPISYQAVEAVNRNLAEASKQLVGTTPTQIVLREKKGLDGIAVALDASNFQKMKSWMYAQTLMSYRIRLTESYRQIASQFEMTMYGTKELIKPDKAAYRYAISRYSEPVSIYYGKTYLSKSAKEDVNKMTKAFIAAYRLRLEKNTWLSDTTRAKAIEKLDKMKIQIGYPDRVRPIFKNMTIVDKKQGGTLVGNSWAIARMMRENNFSKYNLPVDKTIFVMEGFKVNAGYSPDKNTICFPAAILQGSFYNPKQSDSANYGAIGTVIAHEISHAFDPDGAKFDANGSVSNWWTEEDYKKFEVLSQGMIDQFDGIPYADGKVNGTLTVGENIADLSGISCALSVAKSKNNFDPKVFFESYATFWREKERTESATMSLLRSPHAPNQLRVNVQLPNFEEFHQAFAIQPGDAMYRAVEDRVSIW